MAQVPTASLRLSIVAYVRQVAINLPGERTAQYRNREKHTGSVSPLRIVS